MFYIIYGIQKWFAKYDQTLTNPGAKPGSDERDGRRGPKGHYPLRNIFLYLILGIAAFLCVVHFGSGGPGVIKEVSNVHYVDSVGTNFLFRGGLPQTGNPPVFNYKGLKRAVINAGKQAGVKIPASFYLIDVNFLNIENPKDARWISVEQRFFRTKPALGRIQVWGMNGIGLNVNDPALAANREYLARNLDQWLNDKLAKRVETLRGWLEGPSPAGHGQIKLPIVIFIHCVAGCDRTGEFAGAYYLRYLHKSWEEVNALNRSMCHRNRPFGCKNYRAVQWYCLHLNLKHNFKLNWWKEFTCSGK